MSAYFTLDGTGATYPDYADILDDLKTQYQSIYGADVYLESDSQDGAWIAIQAQAIYDAACACVDVYNSLSPATAQSDALTRNVKLNGIRRNVPSYSYAQVRLDGSSGTVIADGQVGDVMGQVWELPASVTIPEAGFIIVSATAANVGAIHAEANTITNILTPTLGWSQVSCNVAAVPGSAVETDAELRARQTISTALPSQSILEGIVGAVANITGVTQAVGYDNDNVATDSHGIPGHSIAVIVEGGDSEAIAEVIFNKKTPGVATYGTTTELVYDQYDIPHNIAFIRPTDVTITANVAITALAAYSSNVGEQIQTAVAESITGNGLGSRIYNTRLYPVAYLNGNTAGQTFIVGDIALARYPNAATVQDIVLGFDENPMCNAANVVITIL